MCNNGCVLLSQKLSYRVQAFSIIRLCSLPTSSLISHKTESPLTNPSIKTSTRRSCDQSNAAVIRYIVSSTVPQPYRGTVRESSSRSRRTTTTTPPPSYEMRCYGYEIRNTPRTNGIQICHMSSTKVPSQWCSTHLASAEPHGHGGSPQITTSHVKT